MLLYLMYCLKSHFGVLDNPHTTILPRRNTMERFYYIIVVLFAFTVLLLGAGTQPSVLAGDRDDRDDRYDNYKRRSLRATLIGYEEVPAVSSTGSGRFKAKLNEDGVSFDYELSYQGLEGNVTQSHIHFAQKSVNGGISIWLCETATNPSPSASTPACANPLDPLDTQSGVVTGTITAAEVIGPGGQGIAAGEFAEIFKAMRNGIAYANVHSSRNTGGEIRGQIR
jgi:hypothetical protein